MEVCIITIRIQTKTISPTSCIITGNPVKNLVDLVIVSILNCAHESHRSLIMIRQAPQTFHPWPHWRASYRAAFFLFPLYSFFFFVIFSNPLLHKMISFGTHTYTLPQPTPLCTPLAPFQSNPPLPHADHVHPNKLSQIAKINLQSKDKGGLHVLIGTSAVVMGCRSN